MNIKLILILIVLIVCIFIVFHHRYIHRLDTDKTNIEKWFQLEDVNNHETVIVGLLGFAVGLFVCFLL